MRKQERTDLEAIQAQVKGDRALAREILQGIDRSQLPRQVDNALTILTSGMLIATIDLGDVLSGKGRQE